MIRLNTQEGATDILEVDQEFWYDHPAGDDVVVTPIGLLPQYHRYNWIPESTFLTNEAMDNTPHVYGPGNEIFFVGRFVTHEGRQRNLPTVRFGNISQMPGEPIRSPRGIDQESFLVEARSAGGYSGSPVFVDPRHFVNPEGIVDFYLNEPVSLLGIDWGHLPHWGRIYQSDKETPISEPWFSRQNSGMMGVVPAWKISEVLHLEEVEDMTKDRANQWLEKHKQKAADFQLDAAEKEQPFTRDDFYGALRKDQEGRARETN